MGSRAWGFSLVDFGPGGFKQVLLSSRRGSYLEFSSPNRNCAQLEPSGRAFGLTCRLHCRAIGFGGSGSVKFLAKRPRGTGSDFCGFIAAIHADLLDRVSRCGV